FVTLKHHAAAFQHLRELRVQLDAQEFDNCGSRQHIDGKIFRRLGAVQGRHMQFSEQWLEFRSTGLGRMRFRKRGRSYEVVAGRSLGLRRQQPFHVAMAHDETCDLQSRLFHKLGAQMYVMPEVVNAQLQAFQSELRRVTAELGRQRLLCGASESENRYAWHLSAVYGRCSLGIARWSDQAGAVWSPTDSCFVTAPSRARRRVHPHATSTPRKLLIFLRVRERSMRAEPGQRYPSYVSG